MVREIDAAGREINYCRQEDDKSKARPSSRIYVEQQICEVCGE